MVESISLLPSVFSSFISSIASLPSPLLVGVDVNALDSSLTHLSETLAKLVAPLASVQQQDLLTNATWLEENMSTLRGLLSEMPVEDTAGVTQEELIQLVTYGSMRYTVMSTYAPEIWAVLLMFIFAIGIKIARITLGNTQAVSRVRRSIASDRKTYVSKEEAIAVLDKPLKSMIAHALNLLMSTFVLCLQFAAWRLFALPGSPMRAADGQLLLAGVKILLVTYGTELLFSDVHAEIYIHHIFTFGLYFIGEIAAYHTKSPKFLRFGQWMLLQATLEQSTYASMFFYHASTYLRVQGIHARSQRRLLQIASVLMNFTKWITFPQKLVPAILATYWIARMWHELEPTVWGRTWLGWCLTLMILLVTLQVKFCDDVFPIAAHMSEKLYPNPNKQEHVQHRTGPVMAFLTSLPFPILRPIRKTVQPEFDAEKGSLPESQTSTPIIPEDYVASWTMTGFV